MNAEPIVITGVGVLAANGLGRRAFWQALEAGVSGIGHVTRFDASALPCQIAGELWDFNPEDFMRKRDIRNWHRNVHQAVASARLAIEDAELSSAGYDPERVATGFGTSVGSPNEIWEEQTQAYEVDGYRKVNKFASSAFAGHSSTVHVSIDCGFRGSAITISSGCSTGLDVVAWGVQQIQTGKADAALVGATEAPIFVMSFAGACSLGILSKRNDAPSEAMRPFDEKRDGIVLSEGAAALVLERADRARARGAPIYAEIGGFGSAAEAANPLILDRKGVSLARAIRQAMDNAGVTPADIDCVQCHGVSLDMYDLCETNAYKAALEKWAYRIPFSASKSMIGQSYAAGGMLGVAASLLSLTEGVVPPTINLEAPAAECDLDYAPRKARYNDVRTAMTVSMSFGGTHSAVVLRSPN